MLEQPGVVAQGRGREALGAAGVHRTTVTARVVVGLPADPVHVVVAGPELRCDVVRRRQPHHYPDPDGVGRALRHEEVVHVAPGGDVVGRRPDRCPAWLVGLVVERDEDRRVQGSDAARLLHQVGVEGPGRDGGPGHGRRVGAAVVARVDGDVEHAPVVHEGPVVRRRDLVVDVVERVGEVEPAADGLLGGVEGRRARLGRLHAEHRPAGRHELCVHRTPRWARRVARPARDDGPADSDHQQHDQHGREQPGGDAEVSATSSLDHGCHTLRISPI